MQCFIDTTNNGNYDGDLLRGVDIRIKISIIGIKAAYLPLVLVILNLPNAVVCEVQDK